MLRMKAVSYQGNVIKYFFLFEYIDAISFQVRNSTRVITVVTYTRGNQAMNKTSSLTFLWRSKKS